MASPSMCRCMHKSTRRLLHRNAYMVAEMCTYVSEQMLSERLLMHMSVHLHICTHVYPHIYTCTVCRAICPRTCVHACPITGPRTPVQTLPWRRSTLHRTRRACNGSDCAPQPISQPLHLPSMREPIGEAMREQNQILKSHRPARENGNHISHYDKYITPKAC